MFSKTGTLAASGDGASALTREVESVIVGREVIFDYTKSIIELFSMGNSLGIWPQFSALFTAARRC